MHNVPVVSRIWDVSISELVSRRKHSGEPTHAPTESPVAVRGSRSRWRDPRLWLGVLLVLGSVALGAKLLAAADDTIAVWQLDRDVPAGLPLTSDDLRTTRVHFADESTAESYLVTSGGLPPGVTLTRDVSAGELLTRSAITTDPGVPPEQLPLGVGGAGLPSDLAAGDHVNVWAVPLDDSARGASSQVLDDVLVLSVGAAGAGGLGSDRSVLVALPSDADVGAALDLLNGTSVVLIRIGS